MRPHDSLARLDGSLPGVGIDHRVLTLCLTSNLCPVSVEAGHAEVGERVFDALLKGGKGHCGNIGTK